MSRLIETPASRSGVPALVVDGVTYHSSYDPVRETSRFLSSHDLEQADVILHFGWGLGYGSDALQARTKPSARIVVFEPNSHLLDLARSRSPNDLAWKDPRFEFVSGADVCQFFGVGRSLQCQEADKILWVEWPAAVRLDGGILEELKRNFKTQLRDRAANLLTHFQNGRMYFRNVIHNIEYQSDPDAGRLFGEFPGIPLVIVSAGPSLDRNARELRGAENSCFLLAVDTALRPLRHAGVTPHAVIMADPTELNARHVIGALPDDTFLIAEQGVHPSALATASRRFLYSLGLFPDPLFAKYGFGKSRLDVWGSVATAALDLACRLQANPIIFAGQDFAYSWNRDYAMHTIFDGSTFDAAGWTGPRAKDVWHRNVPTTENLIAYRDFFVRRIRAEKRTRFINASEGGILTDAVEILSLKDALYQSCRKTVNVKGILESRYRPKPISQAALDHFQHVLQYQKSDCSCLAQFQDLVAKEAVLTHDAVALKDALAWGRDTIRRSQLSPV
jgi:hypothetical protein